MTAKLITEAATFDASIYSPQDGDATRASTAGGNGSIEAFLQKLVNRTKFLKDTLAPSFLVFGAEGLIHDNTGVQFLRPGCSLIAGTTAVEIIMPVAGKVSLLRCRGEMDIAEGNFLTFTVYKNGVATTLTAAIEGGFNYASDVTHSFTVAAGDYISVAVQASSNGVADIASLRATATMLFTNA